MASGRIIKPNQVFRAEDHEIPKNFRHLLVLVDKEDPPLEIPVSSYSVESGSPGWYNVVDGQGKTVNEKQLRQAEAQELVESLS